VGESEFAGKSSMAKMREGEMDLFRWERRGFARLSEGGLEGGSSIYIELVALKCLIMDKYGNKTSFFRVFRG
jgi:hypothetical protein